MTICSSAFRPIQFCQHISSADVFSPVSFVTIDFFFLYCYFGRYWKEAERDTALQAAIISHVRSFFDGRALLPFLQEVQLPLAVHSE